TRRDLLHVTERGLERPCGAVLRGEWLQGERPRGRLRRMGAGRSPHRAARVERGEGGMKTERLVGKLLRVPRLVVERRFDTVARLLAAERIVRLVGVGRTYRVLRWIGFRRLGGWAIAHRLPIIDAIIGEEKKPKGAAGVKPAEERK